jgi:hypothetical protein
MRAFGTFTADLEDLRDWLVEHKVSHVAMESTGVFWIPVWNGDSDDVDQSFRSDTDQNGAKRRRALSV